MIRVTIWNEFRQENEHTENSRRILDLYPGGIHMKLKEILMTQEDLVIQTVTMDMPEHGLTHSLLNETDVLIWWAHVAHHEVSDEVVERVHEYILKGMGFIALHSAHMCKVLRRTLGTSGSLSWRDDDHCRVWNVAPTHPIAEGIPTSFELPGEEMYGEPFDIPKPDDLIFISWFRGGEVFRSGATFSRGYGKIFYFQPGHETNDAYHNPYVQRIITNAVNWAAPKLKRQNFDCPNAIPKEERSS